MKDELQKTIEEYELAIYSPDRYTTEQVKELYIKAVQAVKLLQYVGE